MSYSDLVASDIRLVILRVLAQTPSYSHNEYVLREAVSLYGHDISSDRLRTELAWLSEQALLVIDSSSGVQVSKLTGRGFDVAQGRTVVPGVQRPRPGE